MSHMNTTTKPTKFYPLHGIFLNEIAKWLIYALDSLTNSIFFMKHKTQMFMNTV